MLQWARAQQLSCPWDGDTWDAAIQQEPHEVVQWLRVHGCPEELEWRDDYYDEHWCGGGLHARTTLINSSMTLSWDGTRSATTTNAPWRGGDSLAPPTEERVPKT